MVVYIRCKDCNKDVIDTRWHEHTYFAHPSPNNNFKPNEVQFYSEHVRALANTQQSKIKKFIAYRCIEYVGGGVYICKPILNYNSTIYRMTKNGEGWACTCQHYVMHGTTCSHIGALYEFFALKQVYPMIGERYDTLQKLRP